MRARFWILFAALLLAACAAKSPEFEHGLTNEPRPWSHERFDNGADRVSFAVFSDITGGERPGVFDLAVAQMNLLRPELIVNVGDLIEGDADRAEIDRQWDVFDASVSRARAPVFYVGGNHDLLGAPLEAAWADRLGPDYYHFVYRNVLFLVLDTEDHTPARRDEVERLRQEALAVAATEGWDAFADTSYARLPENHAGNVSEEQSAYFLRVLADHPDVNHTFLFMHKAPWLREDLESFRAIERSLSDRAYTVFHGHEHGYVYRQRNGRDHIQLATTGGVFLPANGDAYDHFLWVTVDGAEVTMANLQLRGILDRRGLLPGDDQTLCLAEEDCPDE